MTGGSQTVLASKSCAFAQMCALVSGPPQPSPILLWRKKSWAPGLRTACTRLTQAGQTSAGFERGSS
ncbi:hypothetical protein D3C87_1843960 [compost metagenome]